MIIFVKDFWKSYLGWILENLWIHPNYLFAIFPQKWQFRLKWKFRYFWEFSLYMDLDNIFRITSQVEISPRIFCWIIFNRYFLTDRTRLREFHWRTSKNGYFWSRIWTILYGLYYIVPIFFVGIKFVEVSSVLDPASSSAVIFKRSYESRKRLFISSLTWRWRMLNARIFFILTLNSWNFEIFIL